MYTMQLSTPVPAAPRPPPSWIRIVRERLSVYERQTLVASHGVIRGAADVVALLSERALGEEVECFYVIAVNAQLRPLALEEIARGTIGAVGLTAREVFRLAVFFGAARILLAHNHPGLDPRPSDKDRELTRDLVSAGELIGIPVLDHVILGGGGGRVRFFSFEQHNLIARRGSERSESW